MLSPPLDEELDRRAMAVLVAEPDLVEPGAGTTAGDGVLAA